MTRPGTWHDSAPTDKVDWPVAITAWTRAAEEVLEDVAAEHGATLTYQQFRDRVFDRTGYRTGMLSHQWALQVLAGVQQATRDGGKPPLAALVVRMSDGGVGAGYVNHDHPEGFGSPEKRQHAAAADRDRCYRVYRDHLPDGAVPTVDVRHLPKPAVRQEPPSRPRSA